MLNKEHFVTIAGNVEALDNEIVERVRDSYSNTYNSSDLCAVQREQRDRGRMSLELYMTIRGYTWRDGSGLANFAIRWRGQSLAKALEYAKTWTAVDELKREAYCSRYHLENISKRDNGNSSFVPSEEDAAIAEDLLGVAPVEITEEDYTEALI